MSGIRFSCRSAHRVLHWRPQQSWSTQRETNVQITIEFVKEETVVSTFVSICNHEQDLGAGVDALSPSLAGTYSPKSKPGDDSSIREIAQFVEDDGNLSAGDVD
jgi:hypothetical protein